MRAAESVSFNRAIFRGWPCGPLRRARLLLEHDETDDRQWRVKIVRDFF